MRALKTLVIMVYSSLDEIIFRPVSMIPLGFIYGYFFDKKPEGEEIKVEETKLSSIPPIQQSAQNTPINAPIQEEQQYLHHRPYEYSVLSTTPSAPYYTPPQSFAPSTATTPLCPASSYSEQNSSEKPKVAGKSTAI